MVVTVPRRKRGMDQHIVELGRRHGESSAEAAHELPPATLDRPVRDVPVLEVVDECSGRPNQGDGQQSSHER